MSETDPAFLPIAALAARIARGELDPRALTRLLLDRTNGPGRALNCYVALCEESALAEAAAASARAAAGRRRGPLDGIPLALKDNIDLAGVPTGNGLGGRPQRVPAEDAEVVRRLRAAGAVILGKLNMHEAALGTTTDNPHSGATINPHRAGYTPGGSSGGSAAAVAAGLACAALGSDTGGSIRIPAAYCGVVGFKPSWGLVSTRGVVPLAPRLDHLGPLARTVPDAALLFAALRGFDPLCTQSRRGGEEAAGDAEAGRLDGIRLGMIESFAAEPIEPEIADAFARALDTCRALGAEIRPVRLPSYDPVRARRAAFLRMEVEAALRYRALAEAEPARFSPQLRAWLDYGGTVPATRLAAADRVIATAAFEIERAFETVDAILSPATPQAAFPFASEPPDDQNSFALLANFTGGPAVSVPMGRNALGLPLGLQIFGAIDRDAQVLRIAAAYETAAAWRLAPPAPFGPADPAS